jgi:superfamily II DNA/RNA helicase
LLPSNHFFVYFPFYSSKNHNAAVFENIDKDPSLFAMTPDLDGFHFVQARASNQLSPDSHREQPMNPNWDDNRDQYAIGSQSVTKCAMPVKFVADDEDHKPNIDKIHKFGKLKKSWYQLSLHSSLIVAIENIGYKRPLPMERILITAVQERVSMFVSGSSGCAKTTATLIAAVDLVAKTLYKAHNNSLLYDVCAPVVVMVVPTHDLAEAALADILTFLVKSDAGLENYVKPLPVHGSIERDENIKMLRDGKAANIIIGTPGRLADMMRKNLLGSFDTQLLIFDQAFTLAGESFIHHMDTIKLWARSPSANDMVYSHAVTTADTTASGPHRGTNAVQHPAPANFRSELIKPRLKPEVPCIIFSQILDLSNPRDIALKKHYIDKVILTSSTMTVRFNENPLHDFHGTIEVSEVSRNADDRGNTLLEDFQKMSGPSNKKVLAVSFDRRKVQKYNSLVRMAGGRSEMLMSGHPTRMWSRDAFSASNLPLLITTTLGSEGNNWRELDNVIIVDMPSQKLVEYDGEKPGRVNSYKSPYHFLVEAIGHVGRLGRDGKVKIYFDPKTEEHAREDLIRLLQVTNTPVPDFLLQATNNDTLWSAATEDANNQWQGNNIPWPVAENSTPATGYTTALSDSDASPISAGDSASSTSAAEDNTAPSNLIAEDAASSSLVAEGSAEDATSPNSAEDTAPSDSAAGGAADSTSSRSAPV